MKSMKAKVKAKKPNVKFGRDKYSHKEINPDLTQLRQPIDTSVSSLYRVTKVLENGSDEVKSILAHECDLVYECRICRSLFRSLVNFISHKRIYCTEKYDITFARNVSNDYDTSFAYKSNIEEPQKTLQETCRNDRLLRSQVCREEQKMDLTAIVNMLQKKRVENSHNNVAQLWLETVQSNSSAVYQTVDTSNTDLMKTQIMELNHMISGQSAVLGPDDQFLPSNQELNSSTNEEISDNYETELVCSICSARFATKKTLTVHTRTLHTSHRLCYPCPCCTSTFANSWSVYRHLYKVHRKSNEQVRKLRSQIQEKAFVRDATAAEELQREQEMKALEGGTLIHETQASIDYVESDKELQRCGGCGKTFNRKAALSAHSQYCHMRLATYEGTTKMKKTNKILSDCISNDSLVIDTEIQANDIAAGNSSVSTEINNTNETSIRVEAVASLSKADWDMLENGETVLQNGTNGNATTVVTNEVRGDITKHNCSPTSDGSDALEIVYTSINKHKPRVGSRKRKNKYTAKKLTFNPGNTTRNIPLKETIEQQTDTERVDQALLMEKKIATIVNLQKLECLPCKRKFTSVTNLRRHAAIHVGWNRYQCKLCDYKCFVKCDCVAHCNKVHNAQNNRVVIAEMIIQIPDDQYTCDQNIMLDITNLDEECQSPEIQEVSIFPGSVESEVIIEDEPVGETETEVVDTKLAELADTVRLNVKAEESVNNDIKSQNSLGLDPDLRKMVMEVIFGSSEINSTKQMKAKETIEDSNSKLQIKEDTDTQTGGSNLNDIDSVSMQDNSKPQRPIRNKIKPLNKDFIYDLKEVALRKDYLIIKPLEKLSKMSLVQKEVNLEKDSEQPSKRPKSLQNDKLSILCENNVIDKCDIKLDRKGLKNSLTFSQCHS